MDSSEQVLQDKMTICRASQEVGVDMPVMPPRTGDEGSEAPFSEYSLHFKTGLVPWMVDGRGQTIDVGFGFGHRVTGLAVATLAL